MAGTTRAFEIDDMASGKGRSAGVIVQLADDLRAMVTDLEVLRVGMDALEDWILEVNTDLELIVLGSASANTAFANNVDAVGESVELTVTGAALGDIALGSLNIDLQDQLMHYSIDAADSGVARLQNESGGTLDLADTNSTIINAYDEIVGTFTGTITAAVLSATNFDAAGDMTAFDITIA